MNFTAAVLALTLASVAAKPRKPTADELRAASATLKLTVDDIEEEQTFAVDQLGPHTLFVSTGCSGFALVRDEKVLLQSAPDKRCRATLDGVTFKDVDGDGRVDVVVLGHDANSLTAHTSFFGSVLLQQADGSFVDDAQGLDWAPLSARAKVTLKDIEQAWRRGKQKESRPKP